MRMEEKAVTCLGGYDLMS